MSPPRRRTAALEATPRRTCPLPADHEEFAGRNHVFALTGIHTPGHQLRMTDLAEAVSFSSGGFTRLADRMEKEGLIRRDTDPADRRAALAVLTDKGGKALDHALTAHGSHLRNHVAGPLSAEDRRHLERILRTLRDANA
jgi:DNA-binding MarR family transcriptional regulator